MDLRPSTLKRLFVEGMQQADDEGDDEDTADVPPPPAAPPSAQQSPAPGNRPGLSYLSWRDGKPYDITSPPLPVDPPAPAEEDAKGEAEDEDVEDAGAEDAPANKPRRRWSPRGSGQTTYRRPVYSTGPPVQKSLIDWWMGIRAPTRWGLYNGTALALGWWATIPQFFTHETAHLVATYHSWTAFYVCVWYAAALAILLFDFKTRALFPVFALVARVPLISLVVGVLLYGTTDFPT